jgi:hypothetical protein
MPALRPPQHAEGWSDEHPEKEGSSPERVNLLSSSFERELKLLLPAFVVRLGVRHRDSH